MRAEEFSSLAYKDQLRMINHSGKLKRSQIINDYQITVYKVKDFYVELKRSIHELTFERITAIPGRDLPAQYR
ncbi:MAG: hypothetical protein ACHQF0_15260 [Chitinophagales bacterium]